MSLIAASEFESILAKAQAATKTLNEKVFGEKVKSDLSPLSDKGEEALELIGRFSACGPTREIMARLMTLALDEDLMPHFAERYVGEGDNPPSGAPEYAVLVPINNPNNHDYPEGEPAMHVDNDGDPCGWLRMDGVQGNCLPRGKASYRPATEAEVEQIVKVACGIS